jgi:hypothetical protein
VIHSGNVDFCDWSNPVTSQAKVSALRESFHNSASEYFCTA